MGKPWMCPYPRRLSRYQIERREVRYRRYRRILLRRALLDLLWRRDL